MIIVDPIIGVIPTKSAPKKGEKIKLDIDGLPPAKNLSLSLRNKKSPDFEAFKKLRLAAIEAMNGHCWYEGSLKINVIYEVDSSFSMFGKNYLGGIMDTLGGSHGFTFTYLPIIYQDDCQPSQLSQKKHEISTGSHYTIEIEFL